MRILLLNPPGSRPFLRDYYCSTVSKSGYLWHPIDLLIQSGFLARHGELHLIDAIADRLTEKRALAQAARVRPDAAFALIGAQSLDEDLGFLRRLSESLPCLRLAVSGEPVLRDPRELLARAPFLRAVVQDFATPELGRWIASGAAISRQVVLGKRRASEGRTSRLSYPVPEHSLFVSGRYRMPLVGRRTYASVISDFGCPFQCTYCNSGKEAIGFAKRPLADLFEEIREIRRLGIRHLFIRNMNFTTPRSRSLEICEWLARKGDMTFNCYSRPDTLDSELCAWMARAGCLLVHVGVEAFDEAILSAHKRPMRHEQIRDAFDLLRAQGIQSGAHFVLGLPGQTAQSIEETIRFAVDLDPDYASFNPLQERAGAALGRAAERSAISPGDLARLARSANLRFYGRPRFWARTARQARNVEDLFSLACSASALLRSTFRAEK